MLNVDKQIRKDITQPRNDVVGGKPEGKEQGRFIPSVTERKLSELLVMQYNYGR